MPVTLTYDQRDAAPEAVREHLVEKDGKFIFEAEPASALVQTNGKLTKLRGDLDAKTARLGKYAKLETLGDDLDIEELLRLLDLKKQGKPLTVDEKAEIERLHKKAADKLTSDLTAEREAGQKIRNRLKHYELTEPVRVVALSEEVGLFPDEFDYVMFKYGDRFKLIEEEGRKPRIVVLDADGDEADMTIKDFFVKFVKAADPRRFKASQAAGSGAQNNTAGKFSGVDLSKLSATERLKAARNANMTT